MGNRLTGHLARLGIDLASHQLAYSPRNGLSVIRASVAQHTGLLSCFLRCLVPFLIILKGLKYPPKFALFYLALGMEIKKEYEGGGGTFYTPYRKLVKLGTLPQSSRVR